MAANIARGATLAGQCASCHGGRGPRRRRGRLPPPRRARRGLSRAPARRLRDACTKKCDHVADRGDARRRKASRPRCLLRKLETDTVGRPKPTRAPPVGAAARRAAATGPKACRPALRATAATGSASARPSRPSPASMRITSPAALKSLDGGQPQRRSAGSDGRCREASLSRSGSGRRRILRIALPAAGPSHTARNPAKMPPSQTMHSARSFARARRSSMTPRRRPRASSATTLPARTATWSPADAPTPRRWGPPSCSTPPIAPRPTTSTPSPSACRAASATR